MVCVLTMVVVYLSVPVYSSSDPATFVSVPPVVL